MGTHVYKPLKSNSSGVCLLCGGSFSRLGSAQHVIHCRRRTTANRERSEHRMRDGPKGLSYHLQMWDERDPDFWLHIDIGAGLTLETLDSFLRQTWMECCYNHLSRFTINDKHYERTVSHHRRERSMNVRLGDVLGSDDTTTIRQFWYEFDFGSTSRVKITIVSARYSQWPGIRLLSHNTLSFYKCDICGSTATTVRHQEDNNYRDQGRELLCDTAKHPPAFPSAQEWAIPNSPRWGICGYSGDPSPTLDVSLFYKGQMDLSAPIITGDRTPMAVGPADRRGTDARVGSMMWAAYGDALGFMFEYMHPSARVAKFVTWPWGMPGIGRISMPAGCMSDYTQLRLATARAIDGRGFNVDAFCRIELPIWVSYAFTTEVGDKAAALNLRRRGVCWWGNTHSQWAYGGGISPAMRVQPHVWAARAGPNWLTDVIANTVTTHGGNLQGLMAACFHASCLARCLLDGTPPTLEEDCQLIVASLSSVPGLIDDHHRLRDWRCEWEERQDEPLGTAWMDTQRELSRLIDSLTDPAGASLATWYESTLDGLRLGWPRNFFSMKVSLVASALASAAPDAQTGVMTALNLADRPSKAIATLAGALLGACYPTAPPDNPLDHLYLAREAERLSALARGEKVRGHEYPDNIRTWKAPKTQVGALSRSNEGDLVVEGLGRSRALGATQLVPSQQYGWQWVRTGYGQTLFIKRRGILHNTRN